MKYWRNPLVIGELLTSAPGIKEYTTLFKGLCNEFFFIGFTEKKEYFLCRYIHFALYLHRKI